MIHIPRVEDCIGLQTKSDKNKRYVVLKVSDVSDNNDPRYTYEYDYLTTSGFEPTYRLKGTK